MSAKKVHLPILRCELLLKPPHIKLNQVIIEKLSLVQAFQVTKLDGRSLLAGLRIYDWLFPFLAKAMFLRKLVVIRDGINCFWRGVIPSHRPRGPDWSRASRS